MGIKAPTPFDRRLFLEPGIKNFEKRAVLNPSVIQDGNDLHMYYRAVDPSMVSTVGYLKARLKNGHEEVVERLDKPLLAPEQDFERMGIEDPRVIQFENKYHMFCTVYDGRDACLGHSVSDDPFAFSSRKRIGPLFTCRQALEMIKDNPNLSPQREWWSKEDGDSIIWEKDAAILPRRIDGKIFFIHRLQPDVQYLYLDSFDQLGDQDFWENEVRNLDKHKLMLRKQPWEASHMGMGPAPIETPEGWLMIFHGVTRTPVKTYRAAAALLDLNDPTKVIGRTPEPLFEPIEEWEKVGDVDNVVFPEGLAVHDNVLEIYYGGADSVIGAISVRLDHLLDYLKSVGN